MLNQFNGKLDKISVVLGDIEKLRPTDEEWAAVGKVENATKDENGKDAVAISWDNNKAEPVSIELDITTVQALKDLIQSKEDNGEFRAGDNGVAYIISLQTKLV